MIPPGFIGWALQTGVAVAVLIGLVLLIRRPFAKAFGAQATYWLWALPALRTVMPPWTWKPAMLPRADEPLAAPPAAPVAAVDTPGLAAPSPAFDWALVLLGFYLAVAALYLTWTLWRHHAFRRHALESATPITLAEVDSAARALGLRRTPDLVEAVDSTGPLTFGLLRPVVVLPHGFALTYDSEARRHVLLHEFAHTKRRDLWAAHAALLFRAVHWPNPLAHIAARSFRADMEAACDAHVLRVARAHAPAYAHTLIQSATPTSGRIL